MTYGYYINNKDKTLAPDLQKYYDLFHDGIPWLDDAHGRLTED
jgi:hypothetical protein